MKSKKDYFDIFEDYNEENQYGFQHINENPFYLNQQILTYMGNKRNLLSFILFNGIIPIQKRTGKKTFSILDGFSGSGITSRFFKAFAKELYVNDLELYSKIISCCYLANISDINMPSLVYDILFLNKNKLREDFEEGIIQKYYSPKDENDIKKDERVFYTPKNARIIDNIRRMISNDNDNFYFLLASLLCKSSISVNTSGVFKGFYKNKDGVGKFGGEEENCIERIKKEIELDIPLFSKYECPVNVYQTDINVLIKSLQDIDITYYDPPYNSHPYGSNYFMLNVISEYKKPEKISKISGIPSSWNKSSYNIKKEAECSFDELINNTKSKFILISYNNEGIITIERMENLLKQYGKLSISYNAYNTFRASRNLSERNKYVKEYLFLLEKK